MLSDGGGLYVRVSVHGSKTFVYRSRTGGKARYVTVGEYPHLSLADAREKVGTLQGHEIGDVTVSYAIDEYLKRIDYDHPEQTRQRLTKDIVPPLGKKRVSSVTSKDLSDALQVIVDRGSPVAANRTLADVKHVFNLAYEKGWIRTNPADRITRKVVGGREHSRSVVLTDDELRHLIAELRKDRFETKTRAALALLILTGQRASEVLGIKGEVKGHWWSIPAERTKPKREQKVYLVPLARWLARHSENSDHRTLSRALKRMKVRYTPHDLRRTMATRMSDIGIMPHVIEKCLNHQMEGVMSVYNRAEFLPEREAAWKLWASHIRAILSVP